MNVVQLFVKAEHSTPVHARQQLILQRGQGIEGDVNAQIGSPRQVLLVSVPTLTRFNLEPGDLRENILLDGAVEQFESGQVLQIGQTALVRLTLLCEPCAVLEQLRPGLAKQIKGQRGFLGIVVRGGPVLLADQVTVTDFRFSPLPEPVRDRFAELVARIHPGKVIRTSELLLALGLDRSYYRTIPALLKRAAPQLPIHRIVTADGRLMTRYIPHQLQALLAEGVEVVADRVSQAACWDPLYFHDPGPF